MATPYELYRSSSIGAALIDTLDDLIKNCTITPQTALKVLAQFDKSIAEVLAQDVQARMRIKGHLDMYRLVDEVWTWHLEDVDVRLDDKSHVQAEKVRVVSCRAKG